MINIFDKIKEEIPYVDMSRSLLEQFDSISAVTCLIRIEKILGKKIDVFKHDFQKIPIGEIIELYSI